MYKIYCAGPLFNIKEKEEMAAIARVLERHGYTVFLPQRDGFEFAELNREFAAMGVSAEQGAAILGRAIFTLDVHQVLMCDGLLLNINGRVPDEGAMVEAGIAWHAGKRIVMYKSDTRSLLNGSDNPLLAGLTGFSLVSEIADLPASFDACFCKTAAEPLQAFDELGCAVAAIAAHVQDKREACRRLHTLFGGLPVMSGGNHVRSF